ncbi:glycosyltransferase family 4 protein [Gluconobacter frateurii]|uniref:glycosyltransferase family 4 protein n=1 Tax=Gluconobacter frateurii TaxID=38308 RepID=UPI001F06A4FC|nr:glycosyltransferase family 4 protein [Gluconobacter frateurii]UMM07228.1 glycosyltransferase family 4 protein [Gluconobacter frateurii]
MSLRVLTVLPPREAYADGHAGAIALLVSRLAQSEDRITGKAITGCPLSGGHFVPLEISSWPLPQRLKYGIACLAAARDFKPDLIEVHNRPDLALFLSRFAPVRLILHNDPCSMRGAKTPAQRQRLADRVLVCGVSHWVAQRFSEGCGSVSVAIQPNCMDLEEVPEERLRQQNVLFAGRVVADKGVDAFVRVWGAISSRYPGWTATIMGADRFGPDSPETPFLAQLRPRAHQAGVLMTGYQPHTCILDAMAEAAIVVVPSRWPEPFGMTALEAMACGAAVIVSSVGALPDVVGDAALLAAPDEPGALEEALCRLMDQAALRSELGRKGRERAARFGLEQARAQLLELRQQALGFSRGSAGP